MTRRVRAAGTVASVAAAVALVAGCGGDASPSVAPGPATSGRATAGAGSSAYTLPSCPHLPAAAGPSALPDLSLPCLGDGPSVNLADLRGTPTVLNVWAAWCTICADEMPVLADGVRRAGDRVRFFGIHYKAPAAYGVRSAADFGVPFPSAQDTDGDRTVAALHATAPPQTFFFAADGSLAGRKVGAITSRAELASLVRRYLGVRL